MGIPQTSVSRLPAIGVVGTMSRPGGIVNGSHVANGICYPGRWVSYSGDQCAHPSAEPVPGQRGGVVLKNEKSVDGAYADKEPVAVLEGGWIIVDPEMSVTRDTQAFARFVTPGSENKGDFRNDPGGATGGQTITVNTATNTSEYALTLRRTTSAGVVGAPRTFKVTSDGTATTTEVAAAFQALIDAETEFVATTSTNTFTVVGSTSTDLIEIVAIDYRMTAASNAAAFKVPALFRTTAATGAVELEVFKQF